MTAASGRLRRAGAGQGGLCLVLLACATCLVALLHLSTGARPIAPSVLIETIGGFDPGNLDHRILTGIRLPRLAAGLACGAALSVSGLLLQSLLRNPLGEPHVLGLNAGASLAVVALSALPAGLVPGMARPLAAALGGGALFSLVLVLASAGRIGLTMTKVTFCGIALSALASALISAILILDQETLEQIRLWLAGDLAGAAWSEIAPALPVMLCALLAAALIAPRLDAMALGDAAAVSLGVPVRATRLVGLVATAALCGGAVSIAGPIGFVGLIVPGIAHRLSGGRHLLSLPIAAIGGGALLLAADVAGRTLLAPQEIATGIMTAFIGAPVFLLIVARTLR
ncbi:iron ABC transporter permease [Rhizobiaceae bacterium BDR2-2]|uniref:Iron ABC transporter permease n=1 Tax=Ectorhizobium quercum TaxID=2965071 RepID=A0AAE3MWR9_9HYPH|nr:iron ABC transporter permease [Ectorhizobium quercum]MCX8995534.1 iron ABC transporter permease [Ectorhizobium quercum]